MTDGDVRDIIGADFIMASDPGCVSFRMHDKSIVEIPNEIFNDKIRLRMWLAGRGCKWKEENYDPPDLVSTI